MTYWGLRPPFSLMECEMDNKERAAVERLLELFDKDDEGALTLHWFSKTEVNRRVVAVKKLMKKSEKGLGDLPCPA